MLTDQIIFAHNKKNRRNLALSRLPEITRKDIERARKYLDALEILVAED